MVFSLEDQYMWYSSDKVIGRYGPLTSASPQFVDDYFGSLGGVPLNINSVDFEAGSSQYADRADTASLSITGDLSIRVQIKPESLPTVGNSSTLVAKWTEAGNLRSYKFDIYAVSGYFGDGSGGALTVSSNTTQSPTDASCSGTSGQNTVSATNASFAADQLVLVIQMRGTGAGTWQRSKITNYTAGTVTIEDNLNFSYNSTGSNKAQIVVIPQYTNITVNNGITWSAKAWTGTVGGILLAVANGTITSTGTTSGSARGFVGGAGEGAGTDIGNCGEGTGGASAGQQAANGNGGGAGDVGASGDASGAGGGNGTSGTSGTGNGSSSGGGGVGGSTAGTADLTTMVMGGGGGSGKSDDSTTGDGGTGGAIIFLSSTDLIVTGAIVSAGGNGSASGQAGSGGGAGGSILLKAQTATLGTALITAPGGSGGDSVGVDGGAGGAGRIHLDYYTSYTGTTTPTLDVTQDNNLVTTTTYQLRLAVSSDGTAFETLAQEANTLQTAAWQQVAVSWDASASSAVFYLNGVALGTRTGALTAIHDNTSVFGIGKYVNGAGAAAGFYDGLMDEAQVFNNVQTASDHLFALNQQISVTTSGLQFYGKLNGDYTDATTNANNLTASGSPVFSSDVPFPSPTTRQDIDQSATTAGQTYTTPTAISEAATARKTFTPAKDPQKSIAVLVAAAGSGDVTLTVHNTQNEVIASKTILAASMTTGYVEFIFSSVWRPLTNFTEDYHFHVTSTVADTTLTTTTLNDLEKVSYRTYYQFLVEDIKWHPMARFLNFWVVGNERYVGKYEATLYEPNKITLGAGWRVRAFGYWQEYLAIGCMKGTNIYDFDMGRVYFWDGYSPTFNFYIDIPEGGVNALLGTRGQLYIWAGYHADLLVYRGGSYADKLKEVPLLAKENYAEVYPGAASMWQANPRFGMAGSSDSTDIGTGVYTWGSTNKKYDDILTFDYPISTGNYGSSVNIGMVMPLNQELLIGWKDNVSYGVDYVNNSNNPYPTASIEFMVEDLDVPYKEKQATQLVATFDPLLSGESINVKYMNEENDTGFVTNPDSPATGDITVRRIIENGRYYHLRVAVDLSTTGSTSPTVKGVALETDQLEDEDVIG